MADGVAAPNENTGFEVSFLEEFGTPKLKDGLDASGVFLLGMEKEKDGFESLLSLDFSGFELEVEFSSFFFSIVVEPNVNELFSSDGFAAA